MAAPEPGQGEVGRGIPEDGEEPGEEGRLHSLGKAEKRECQVPHQGMQEILQAEVVWSTLKAHPGFSQQWIHTSLTEFPGKGPSTALLEFLMLPTSGVAHTEPTSPSCAGIASLEFWPDTASLQEQPRGGENQHWQQSWDLEILAAIP